MRLDFQPVSPAPATHTSRAGSPAFKLSTKESETDREFQASLGYTADLVAKQTNKQTATVVYTTTFQRSVTLFKGP